MNPTAIMIGLSALFLGLLFLIAGIGSRVSFGRSGEAASMPQTHPIAPTGTTPGEGQRFTAADLWAQYHRDPVAADRRFKDKSFLVTGTVVSSGRDFHSNLTLLLSTGQVFETVRATLESRDGTAVLGIVKGQTVTVTCIGRGALIGAPILDGCTVN